MRLNRKRVLSKMWGFLGSVSIRTKIVGIILGSTLLISISFFFQVRASIFSVLEQKIQEQGSSIANDVAMRATELILVNDLYSLNELIYKTKQNYSDIRYVFVLDSQQRVLAHTFGEGFPLDLIGLNAENSASIERIIPITNGEEEIWDVSVPILEGQAGTARIGISNSSVLDTLYLLSSQLGWTILAILTISLFAAIALTWVLTDPILKMADATAKIATGDFSPRLARWANDELGDLAIAFNQMARELGRLDALRKQREELRHQLLVGVINAQEDERSRIARELHDSTSQSLTSLIIGLQNLEEHIDGLSIRSQIEAIKEETVKTLDEVHALAVQLRPAVLDDLGLEAALKRLVEYWQARNSVSVDLLVHIGKDRLTREIETTLYRIIQEALTNVARHAQATSVSILIEQRNEKIIAIIEDNGIGFDAQETLFSGRLGLLGMQERAELVKGKFTVESNLQRGTSIFVTIPMQAEIEFASA